MAIKLYKYCYVFATLLIAQPLFSFISNIQKVFYLQLFVLNLKQFSAQKLCVFTDHSSYERRRIFSILWWLKLSDSVTAVCVLTSLQFSLITRADIALCLALVKVLKSCDIVTNVPTVSAVSFNFYQGLKCLHVASTLTLTTLIIILQLCPSCDSFFSRVFHSNN